MKRLYAVSLICALLGCGTAQKDQKESPQKKHQAGPSLNTQNPVEPPLGSIDENELRILAQSKAAEDREKLQRYLSSAPSARRWASFALGLHCTPENSEGTVSMLVNAAAAWISETKPVSPSLLQTVAWAIGACAAPESEDVLRGWLTPDPSTEKTGLLEAGIFGLGSLADRQGTLNEQTQTAILDAAARENRADLLLPLGRIGRLSEAVGAHILEVTGNLLTKSEASGRRHAIFALGSAGPSAAPPLAQVLLAETFSPQERAAAAQALGRLGSAGEEALDQTIAELLDRGLPIEHDRPLWIPLRAAILALQRPDQSKKQLAELTTLVLTEGTERNKSAQRRRAVWLRCQAARLLAGTNYEATSLLACDPDKGRDFSLAQLEVVGTDKLTGKRGKQFLTLLKSADPVVVQAALRMIPSHPEVEGMTDLLLAALASNAPGTQATAAQIIAAYPSRAQKDEESGSPDERIIEALKNLLGESNTSTPTETRAAAIKAAGALRALSLKPEVERLCKGNYEALFGPAERALALLGSPNQVCRTKNSSAASTDSGAREPVTLVIDSDVGELLLQVEASDAPVSAAHFLKNVDAGFYNGLSVHAAREGFAVQFGDKDGDGFQDSAGPALPHEVSPTPFSELTFGMSAFSPGSQDAQIFVVVSDAAQLTGTRVRLGTATGPWHLVAAGDVFHSVKRK